MEYFPHAKRAVSVVSAVPGCSWIQGEMTNFEYLMELNKLSGRTFNDLMQYPIFPYILADYTSPTLNLDDPLTFRQAGRV